MAATLTSRPNKILAGILVFAVLTFPVSSVGELGELFQGTLADTATVYTSPLLKGFKDVVFVSLILYLAIKTAISGSVSKIKIIWLSAVATMVFPLLAQPYIPYSLFGLRWAMPFILTALMIDFVDRALIDKVGKAVLLMYTLHFVTQLVQVVWMPPFFATTLLGLTRAPGFFANAGTAALYTVLSIFWAMHHFPRRMVRSAVLLTAPLSIMLAASGTGVVVAIILYLIFAFRAVDSVGSAVIRSYLRLPVILSLIIAPIIVFAFLNEITGREGYVEMSGGNRLDLFLEALTAPIWLSTRFGSATNTAMLATLSGLADDHGAWVVDSMATSLILNLGLPLAILFSILPLVSIFSYKSELTARVSCLVIIVAFSAVTNISEIFPANLLCALLLAYYSISPNRSWTLSRHSMISST